MDKYMSFADLCTAEPAEHFEIACEERIDSQVIVIAPHGGKIEVHTSEIAREIAGEDFSYYSFKGKKRRNNRDLHITSHRFDEPSGVHLVTQHRWVVAVHGCKGDAPQVFLGGLDADLKVDIVRRLAMCGIRAETGGHEYPGQQTSNICNRGAASAGVQIELTMPFREKGDAVSDLVVAVRDVLLRRTGVVRVDVDCVNALP
jgi:phage replication-related protein YjqB (UPF0714/DUF867 family)